MRKTVVLFASIAVSIVLSSYCHAQEKRLALVIGNSSYKHYSPLKNPVNDAKDMDQALEKLGFDVMQRFNVGKQDMEDAIRDFGKQLAASEVGFFYFSGHGSQMNGENYLLPSDALIGRESDIEYKMVHVRLILDEMKDAKNRLNVIILDACRTNPFPRSGKNIHLGLAPLKPPTGMLIAYAASPNEQALDDLSGNNSFYTANLLKYMTVEGITLEQYFKRVREGVLNDTANRQKSWEETSLTGKDFYFVSPSQPPPPQKATLNVTADVSGAEVWVNGNKQGVLPKNFTISDAGKYEVEVTAPGYKKYRTSKNIELGKEYEVAVHLEKEQTESELLATQVKQPSQQPKYQLRSKPMKVSYEEALKVFKLGKNLKPLEYVKNEFEDNGDTITDHATGLMWQKPISESYMKYENSEGYIDDINRKRFAGFNDWRLPTVDELASLLTSEKQSNYLYINPIFDKTQLFFWTSDHFTSGGVWLVRFRSGDIGYSDLSGAYYVRAVRSLTP